MSIDKKKSNSNARRRSKSVKSAPKKHAKRWLLFGGVLALIIVGGILWWTVRPTAASQEVIAKSKSQLATPKYALPTGDPQKLTVASADISAPMGPVNLPAGASELVPPFDIAAWYADGPKPGFPGPAVIVGHVDSTSGPNVFWNLHKVETGDQVVVQYPHQKLTFQVTSTQTSPQDQLPTAQIWNKTSTQVLRLITCIGTFDYSTRHYSDNYIVYATETSSVAD